MPTKKNKEEEKDVPAPRISINCLEKSVMCFSSDNDGAIDSVIEESKEILSLMQWSNVEKFMYAKRLLVGSAKLFIRTSNLKNRETLQNELMEEFGSKLNNVTISKKLIVWKMWPIEICQQNIFFT